ncbi:MAG TPA: polysaccharide biosynthesis tyrosine autokinase [Vicinamibacteria bacterium]
MSKGTWIPEVVDRREPEGVEYYPSENEIHLRDYWYIVLKRRWLILAVLTVVLSWSTARALMRTPMYSATAVLQLDRGKINLVQDVMIPDYWSGYTEFYPTQERVLRSRDLAQRVVKQLRLWEHPYFTGGARLEPTDENLENLSGAVLGMLDVGQIRNTQLMEVRFTSADPKLSAELSNALAHQFMTFNSERESNLARNTAGFIREQIEKIQQEIQQKEKLLQEYSQREDLVMVDEKEVIVMKQLDHLNDEFTEARASRAAAEASYRSTASADPGSLLEVQSHPTVVALRQEQAALEREVAVLAAKFKDDWPELKRAKESLALVKAKLESEQRAVARKVVAAAERGYREAREREALLSREANAQKGEAQELNRVTTDYNQIKVELDNQRQMLQQLLRKQSETGLTADLGEQQPVNVRVVEAALVPRGPNGPGLHRSLFLGILVGLGLALGLAFFLDYWETNIYTIDDLKRHVPLPYMGMVPRLEGGSNAVWGGMSLSSFAAEGEAERRRKSTKKLSTTRTALALAQRKVASRSKDDVSMVAERFKFLRGSLLLSKPGSPPRVVLVTGPDKNAGKTFVACNLAMSLTDLDKKVLIIDADLRNPQLHKIFGFKNRVGLSNVLSGQASLRKGSIVSTPIPNFYALLAGPPSPTPAELLGSQKMEETLAECVQHFDYVVLDSAPLLPVFDSHYLTVKCDANVLVVRSGQTSRNAVKQSLDLIDRVGGKVTGVVLNDVNLSDFAQNYYYTYHSYEYGTYAEEPVERAG